MRALQTASASTQAVAIPSGSCTKFYPTFTPKWGQEPVRPKEPKRVPDPLTRLDWDIDDIVGWEESVSICRPWPRLLPTHAPPPASPHEVEPHALSAPSPRRPYGLCPGNWVIESLPSHMQDLWTWKGKEDWIWNVPLDLQSKFTPTKTAFEG